MVNIIYMPNAILGIYIICEYATYILTLYKQFVMT